MSSIAELEKYLMKNVMAGKTGAAEVREFLKAKMRQNVLGRIANSHGATPSGVSQEILERGGEDIAKASRKLLQADRAAPIDQDFMTDAMMRYAALTKGRR